MKKIIFGGLLLLATTVNAEAGLWGNSSGSGAVYLADCSVITAGFCIDTDDGAIYYWNGSAVTASGGSGDYTLPVATALVLGGVIDGEGVSVAADGTLSVTAAGIGLGTSDNPAFNSLSSATGNIAAANTQVTKKWITGLGYTANLTSVIYGGKHYICTSTHTAGSTTEPGVGASWETVWSEASGTAGASAIDDLTDVDTTGKATGKVLKFDAAGNLVVGDDLQAAEGSGILHATSDGGYYMSKDGAWTKSLGTFTGAIIPDTSTLPAALQALETSLETIPSIIWGTGLTNTANTISVTANTYQAYDVDLTTWAGISPTTGTINTTGALQGKVPFNSYATAQTLTAATHNSTIVQMTVAAEVTMWDCETANVGDTVMLWARDAEKIEVVPASGDHFAKFDGTAITADYELDMAATAGTKVTLMCTADDAWSVYSETAASVDGGAAD